MTSRFLSLLRDVSGSCSARTAVSVGAERITYGELAGRAGRVAAALARRGLSGRTVGILAGPGPAWVAAFLGTAAAGARAVALSPLYPELELRPLVERARAGAILASREQLELAVCVAGSAAVFSVDELLSEPEGSDALPEVRDEDVALVLFTSGTTGRPKGALLTHSNLYHQVTALRSSWGFREDDVLVHALPLHHLHGIAVALLVALAAGAEVVFLPRFDAAHAFEAFSRATVFMGVPTQHRKLVEAHDAAPAETRARWRRAFFGLRLVTSGSAALPRSLGERLRELAGEYPLERYGMTEIGIVLSNPLGGDRRPGTVGVPLPGVAARVVDEQGVEVGSDIAGELWIQAPTVFAGYADDPGATAAAFSSGWFRTGDTAARSEDGYVRILGRTSTDILKSGGYKLSALEIEDVLREHPAVADVAVVGVPDDTWGDLVVAVVTKLPGRGADVDEESLRLWARGRLAAYKLPKRVLFFDELPRNALGKVTKAPLVEEVLRHI